ncbi:PD-(D/E)XK nuclease family protein [Gulosibacter sp. ACHW.36C]|uniref:DNA 3'-5' helicase n=1 Tax=Gulosibacter sediminis TaxID=1729695 RepID=A0ABY4N2T3_9MICO|nr:PD-(D/E)XK nuclease family protein [Gulosibacter sediminis]UQN15833.1 PD-(D/E)XK nuclease family protein [Gulosibacter sediminis]
MQQDAREAAGPATALDASQIEVLSAAKDQSLSVLGAPGSGRTSTLVELVAERVEAGLRPDELLVLAANRRSADLLRERVQRRLARATRGATLGRTPASIAMEIIADARVRSGGPRPVLLTGSAQDDILSELIEGYLDGTMERLGRRLPWPEWFSADTMSLAGFRGELRDLITALTERGMSSDDLAALALEPGAAVPTGQRHRALWAGAAALIRDYENSRFDRSISGADEREAFDTASALMLATQLLSRRTLGRTGVDVFDGVRLVCVDDAQELTESARALVAQFERQGARIVTFGDPDTATGSFHAGHAAFAVNWRDAGDPAPATLTLQQQYRHDEVLRGVVARAVNGLPPLGASDRRRTGPSETVTAAGRAEHAVLESANHETELIAGYLRHAHLIDGVPWSDMAVIARNSTRLEALSRGFDRAGVAAQDSAPIPAANDATVRAILTMAAGIVRGEFAEEELFSVLASPLYRVDSLLLRRLRRACYLADLGIGDTPGLGRGGGEVLADHVNAALRGGSDASAQAAIDSLAASAAAHAARSVTKLLEALGRMNVAHTAGATIDAVLFEAWADARREQRWRDIALGVGEDAVAMNRRLDAVVALFDRAKRVVEREPTVSLDGFLVDWQRDSVVDDSLARRGAIDAVTLTTPAGAIGRTWRVVVVASINEGAWPNLRVRDSLLGAGRLTEAQTAAEAPTHLDRRAGVLADEQRLLAAAVSRTTERLLLTAVRDDENAPSQFVHRLGLPELPPGFAFTGIEGLEYAHLSLDQLAARLRREAAGCAPQQRAERVAALAQLTRHGVEAADPANWFGIHGRSTTAPLVAPAEHALHLKLYPSGIQSFKECSVNWFIDQHAGGASNLAMSLGTIIHSAAEHEADFATLEAMIEFTLHQLEQLEFDAPWLLASNRQLIRDATISLWDYLKREGVTPLAGERAMLLELERPAHDEQGTDVEVQIRGRIDRIEEHRDTGIRIVDFKTGTTAQTKADENDQLRAYQVAALRNGISEFDLGGIALEGAALVYPRIASGRGKSKVPWKVVLQERPTENDVDAAIDEFVTVAIQQAAYQLEGDAPDTSAPAQYFYEPEGHCLDGSRSCLIHAIGEVTE